jgi:ATP-dependent Lon protease
VLKHALVRELEPIEWTEPETPATVPSIEEEAGASMAH